MNRLTPALLVAAVLACAAPHAQTPSEPRERTTEQQIAAALKEGRDPRTIRVCEYEEVTGSHIREITCRNLDDKERERAATQRTIQQMQQQHAPKPGM